MRTPTHISLPASQQRKINYLQNSFTPYFLITLFAGCTALIRLYLLREWAWWQHLGSFVAQIISLSVIWYLIKWLNSKLEERVPFEHGPLKRMFLQVFLTFLILSPIIITATAVIGPRVSYFHDKAFVAITFGLFAMIIFLFNFSFYASYFFRNWQSSVEEKATLEVQAATLEHEKLQLQYDQLRNQVNPHYLFNTLTSLDGLIHTNPELASEFVRHMAKVYRYVLRHKESEVVNLDEEIDFIGHYIELLQIRYANGINIKVEVSDEAKDKGIVMVTLQTLIDNAIKHNIIHPKEPLNISIGDDGEYLAITNNKQLRNQIETSNRQGLQQLKQLYNFLTDKAVIIEDTADAFTIKLPLL